jgi:hypothetical protein
VWQPFAQTVGAPVCMRYGPHRFGERRGAESSDALAQGYVQGVAHSVDRLVRLLSRHRAI